MQKKEFLSFLRDEDVCKEIYHIVHHFNKPTPKSQFMAFLRDGDIGQEIFDIIRRSGKPAGSSLPAGQYDHPKTDFLGSLRDAEICKEIFNIILNGGKPLSPLQKSITSNGADINAVARRNQLRNQITTTNPEPAPTPTPPAEVEPQTPAKKQSVILQEKLNSIKARGEKIEAGEDPDSPIPNIVNDTLFTLVVERGCPVCRKSTRVVTPKIRLNFDTEDADFCRHYQNFDMYLYSVWNCEYCGYTAEDTKFQQRMPDAIRNQLKVFLDKNELWTPFAETRNKEDALALYDLAIFLMEITSGSLAERAMLYQKMAWICRIENDEREYKYLLDCAELLEQSIGKERYPIGKITNSLANYIAGFNFYTVGDTERARKFIGNIIGSQSIRTFSPNLYEKARDIWQDIRYPQK